MSIFRHSQGVAPLGIRMATCTYSSNNQQIDARSLSFHTHPHTQTQAPLCLPVVYNMVAFTIVKISPEPDPNPPTHLPSGVAASSVPPDACLESWREVTAADLRHLAANYHSDASRSRAAGRLHTWLMRHPERWGVLCMRGATWAAFSAAIWATWGASGRRMEALPLTTAALLLLFCSAALAVSLVVPALLALQYPHISSAGSHFSQGRPVNAPARAPSSRLGLSPLSQWPLLGPWDPQQQQPLLQDFTWGRRSTWGSTTTADSSQHDGAGVAKAGRARATAVCALTASVVIFTAAMANLVLEYMRVSMADGRLPMQHA